MCTTIVQLCLLATIATFVLGQDTNSTLIISEDGNCGGTTGQTCLGSTFGDCCSGKGYCGGTTDYCNAECQADFGSCAVNASSISTDGRCGTTDTLAQICLGSSFGGCCSETGWCGSTDVYCGTGCQGDFGDCSQGSSTSVSPGTPQPTGTSTSPLITPTSTASSSTSSPTTTASAAPAVDPPSSSTMSTGAKAGAGVAAALGGIALIAGLIFLFRRRSARKQTFTNEVDEKAEIASTDSSHRRQFSEAPPSSAGGFGKDVLVVTKDLPPMPMPAELGNQRSSRAELASPMEHGEAVELDSKGGRGHVVELPAGRD